MHARAKQVAVAVAVTALLGIGAFAAFVTTSTGASLAAPVHASGSFTLDFSSTVPANQCDTVSEPSSPACWTCTYNLNVDQATILINQDTVKEGVRFAPGCTGRIGKLTVVTQGGDGVKSMNGAHDLVVGGGSVTCNDPSGPFATDQYGIRAFGGKRITYAGMYVNCSGSNSRFAFFVNQVPTTQSGAPLADRPDGIQFLQGCLGSSHFSTALIGNSINSGVATSTVHPYIAGDGIGPANGPTFDIPAAPSGNAPFPAVNPLTFSNTVTASGPATLCTSANG